MKNALIKQTNKILLSVNICYKIEKTVCLSLSRTTEREKTMFWTVKKTLFFTTENPRSILTKTKNNFTVFLDRANLLFLFLCVSK